MLSRTDLHDYQNKAIDFIIEKRRCALFLAMGLGKTTATLTAAKDLIHDQCVSRVLVVAPLRVANSVWRQEAAKWQHLQDLDISIATGSEKDRLKALSKQSQITVINRENIPWLVKTLGNKWPFDMLVIDESSSFKSSSSKRFKALRKVLPFVNTAVLLTGTPSPNGLLDLWAQIFILDYGNSLGRTMTNYKQRFFVSDYMGYSWEPKPGAKEKIYASIEDMVMSLQAEDYIEVPDRIDINIDVPLSSSELKAYKEFEKEMFMEIDDEEIEAMSAAILANKLLQFSNGAMYTDALGNWSEIHTRKLDALQEIIDENPDENLLVAYNYKSDLARLLDRFPDAVLMDKDPETIARWNRGEIKMMLAHPASAGHGLNLQYGGSVVVWFGLVWSLELYQQFNARLHRQGQDKPTRVLHLVSKGTIDERVLGVLNLKDATQADLLLSLKK